MFSERPQAILWKTAASAVKYIAWPVAALPAVWHGCRIFQGAPSSWSLSGLRSFIFFSIGDPATRHLFVALLLSGIPIMMLLHRRIRSMPFLAAVLGVSGWITGTAAAVFVPEIPRIDSRFGSALYVHSDGQCRVELFPGPPACRGIEWIRRPCPDTPKLLLSINGIPDSMLLHRSIPPFPESRITDSETVVECLLRMHAGGHVVADGISGGDIAWLCLQNQCSLEIFEPRRAVIHAVAEAFSDFTADILASPDVIIHPEELHGSRIKEPVDLLLLDFTRYRPRPIFEKESRQFITADTVVSLMEVLSPDGVIAVRCFRRTPMREILRILDTMNSALSRLGKTTVSDRLIVIASADTAIIVIAPNPLPVKTIAAVNWFVRTSSEFDALWAPGINVQTVLSDRIRMLDGGPPETRVPVAGIHPMSAGENDRAKAAVLQMLQRVRRPGRSAEARVYLPADPDIPRDTMGAWCLALIIMLFFIVLL